MFGWYFIWVNMANNDITKLETVGNLPLQEWLNYMLIMSKQKEVDDILNNSNMVQFG